MKRILIIYILLCITIFLVCCRRPLREDYGVLAMVPIHIDWSKSNLNVDNISRVTVRVFPHDGSPAYDHIMQSSITDDVLPLRLGTYSFVVFNETIDPDDWYTLKFMGTEKYETFVVTTYPDEFKGLYTKSDASKVNKSPDHLSSWSLDEFDVTQDMIIYNSPLANSQSTKVPLKADAMAKVEQQLTKVSSITPVPVTRELNILAYVKNLVSAKRSSGALSGAVGEIQLSTRLPTSTRVAHIFIMNGRVYDNPKEPKHGTIGANITIFDHFNDENHKVDFTLDFMLHNGDIVPSYVFDVTEELKVDKPVIDLRFGFLDGLYPDDKEIILPVIKETGSVEVDGWDDVIISLP